MLIKNRIKKHSEFQELIANGILERTPSIAMYYNNNTYEYTRIGISVPKKSGIAVVRNKIKRQIRAICAQVVDFSKPIDIVFIVRKAYNVELFEETKNQIKNLLSKIGQ